MGRDQMRVLSIYSSWRLKLESIDMAGCKD